MFLLFKNSEEVFDHVKTFYKKYNIYLFTNTLERFRGKLELQQLQINDEKECVVHAPIPVLKREHNYLLFEQINNLCRDNKLVALFIDDSKKMIIK